MWTLLVSPGVCPVIQEDIEASTEPGSGRSVPPGCAHTAEVEVSLPFLFTERSTAQYVTKNDDSDLQRNFLDR
jgi:hypothetical protein